MANNDVGEQCPKPSSRPGSATLVATDKGARPHMTARRRITDGMLGTALAVLAVAAAACNSSTGASSTSSSTTSTSSPNTSAASSTSTTSTTTASTTSVAVPIGGVIPADFQPSSFTAVSLDQWWLLGTARCLSGSGTCGAIVRTTDGGLHFAGIPSPPVGADDVTQLRFADARDGYAFDPELWTTTNGGSSWAQVTTPGVVTELEVANGEAYALACTSSSASCQSIELIRSSVGAHQWQVVSTPTPLGYHSQFALSGSDLYLLPGADHQVLMYSADKGANFSSRTDPCHRGIYCSVTAAADGTATLWSASPTGTEAEALVSDNGGITWRTASPSRAGFPNSLGLAAASASVALAWPGEQVNHGLPAGLERTTNAGESYSAVLDSSWGVSWAGFSDPARAYAIAAAMETDTRGPTHLFESSDGGASWHEVAIKS
jgi:hypothetical protein